MFRIAVMQGMEQSVFRIKAGKERKMYNKVSTDLSFVEREKEIERLMNSASSRKLQAKYSKYISGLPDQH